MPAKPGTLTAASIYPADLKDLHYIKARLTSTAYLTKTRKSKRVKVTGIPSVLHLVIGAYLRRFKGAIPF